MKKEEKEELQILPNSNKGLSTIVATLIIILLVLVAAGIIWVVVRDIITKGAEGIDLGKFTFDLRIKSAYIDNEIGSVKVMVRRNPGGGNLIGVRFVFFNGTRSSSVDRKTPLQELEEELFSFDSVDVGDTSVLQEVSVAPIYESSSGKETVGDITDTATILGSLPPGGNGGNGDGESGPACTTDDDCLEGWLCINDVCIAQIPGECGPENPCPEGYDCIDNECVCAATCDTFGYQCEIASICGEQLDCGEECDAGEYCSSNMCMEDIIINSGIVQDIFTIDEPFQFSSADLPYWADINLQSKYVNFTGLEVCARIDLHHRMESVNYVRLDQIVPGLTAGLNYDVWNNTQCGS